MFSFLSRVSFVFILVALQAPAAASVSWPSNTESCCKGSKPGDCGRSCSDGQFDCGRRCCKDGGQASQTAGFRFDGECPRVCDQGTWQAAAALGTGKIKECQHCPLGTSTPSTYSKSSSDCSVTCPQATWSDRKTHSQKCAKCWLGAYGVAGLTGQSSSSTACPNRCNLGYCGKARGKVTHNDACRIAADGEYACATTGCAKCTKCARCYYGTGTGKQTQGSACPDFCRKGWYCKSGTGFTSHAAACGECVGGYYSDADKRHQCTPCPAGRYGNVQRATSLAMGCPSECPVGYRGIASGKTNLNDACQQCGPNGEYQTATGQTSCQRCPAGKSNDQMGSSTSNDCSSCAAGSWSNVGAATCTLCAAGTSNSNTGSTSIAACTSCPQGSYSTSAGSASCTVCLPGTRPASGSSFSSESTACLPCLAGHYCPSGGNTAPKKCPLGRWGAVTGKATMAAGCTESCPLGQHGIAIGQTTESAACGPCGIGKFANETGLDFCSECEEGMWQTQTGQSSCLGPCPAGWTGKVGVSGATSQGAACTACPAGRYCDGTTGGTGTLCPKGRWGAVTGKATLGAGCPNLCPAGSKGIAAGQTTENAACAQCGGGRYQPGTGKTSCLWCPRGTFGDVTGAASLAAGCPGKCPVGSTATTAGQTTESQACSTCLAGTFMNSTGATEPCFTCPAGRWCPSGSESPQPCPAGRYCAEGTTAPVKCPVGSFSASDSLKAESECTPCSAGRACTTPGLTAPDGDCPSGSYCVSGAKESGTGASFVAGPLGGTGGVCPPGHYCKAGTKFATEFPCPNGTASAATGAATQKTCAECPAGKACSGTGLAGPTGDCRASFFCPAGSKSAYVPANICPAGSFCPPAAAQPSDCPSGTFNPDEGGSEEAVACRSCTAGFYCATPKLAGPTGPCDAGFYCSGGAETATPSGGATAGGDVCPAGSYCPRQSVEPTPCPVTTFSNTEKLTAESECSPCTAGMFCATSGITAPTAVCPAGSYCPEKSGGPTPCPASTFSNNVSLSASSQCQSCIAGMFCAATGLTAPTGACDAGFYCPAGQTAAAPSQFQCPPGHYCPAATRFATEFPCPSGTFNSGPGSKSNEACAPCTGGFYCATAGLSAVTGKCSPGFYCDSGSTTSKKAACTPGNFCPEGSAAPTPCPASTFSNNVSLSASSQCQSCTAGMFCAATGLTAPTGECDAGFYCPSGQISAEPPQHPCPRGFYCPYATANYTSFPCPPGTSNNDTHQTNETGGCPPCPDKMFQPASGQALCKPCPAYTVTEPDNRTSCVERTVTPVIREPTVIPTTGPSKKNEQPESIKTILDIASLVGIFSGAAAAGVAQSRLQNALQLAACGTGEYLEEQLDFMSSPMAIEIGSQPLAYHRGAVIVHFICVAISLAVFYGVAFLYWLIKRPPFRVAAARTRMPGLMYVPLSILAGGAAEAAAALIWHGSTTLDYVLGAVDVLFLVVAPTVWVLYLFTRSKKLCRCQPKPYLQAELDKKEREKAKEAGGGGGDAAPDASAAQGEDVELLELQRELGLDSDDDDEDEGPQRGPNKKHCFSRNCPRLYAVFRWVAVNHSEWVDVEPTEMEVDKEGNTEKLDLVVLEEAMAYEDYNEAKFGPAEVIVTAVMGCTAGIGAGILSRPACLMWLFVATVFIWLHFIALLWLRPLLNRGLATFITVSTGVSAVTTLLALLQFLGKELDWNTSYLSLSSIQTVVAVLATFLNFIAAGVVVMDFYTALQKGHQKGREGEHHNFDDLFLEMELEEIEANIQKDKEEQERQIELDLALLDAAEEEEDEGPAIDLDADFAALAGDDEEEEEIEVDLDQFLPEEVELEVPEPPAPEPEPEPKKPTYELDDSDVAQQYELDDGENGAQQYDENGNAVGSAKCANAAQLAELRAALGDDEKKETEAAAADSDDAAAQLLTASPKRTSSSFRKSKSFKK